MPINTKIHSGGLADNAVSTDKIAGDAVTTAKVADNAVTSAKLPDGGVAIADLATNTGITTNYHKVPVYANDAARDHNTTGTGTPAAGMIIFNTADEALQQYTGNSWSAIAPAPTFSGFSGTPTINEDDNTTVVIQGSQFIAGMTVALHNNSGDAVISGHGGLSYVLDSFSQITVTVPSATSNITSGLVLYFKITKSGLSVTTTTITVNADPTWASLANPFAQAVKGDVAGAIATLPTATASTGGAIAYSLVSTTSATSNTYAINSSTGAVTNTATLTGPGSGSQTDVLVARATGPTGATQAADLASINIIVHAVAGLGGTINSSYVSGYNIHIFNYTTSSTTDQTFSLYTTTTCDILVVAGGGGGGYNGGGGGGAGGILFNDDTDRASTSNASVSLSAGDYTIRAGSGGAVGTNGSTDAEKQGKDGDTSSFINTAGATSISISTTGGGGGGSYFGIAGRTGGSGGGGGYSGGSGGSPTGNQGYDGGTAKTGHTVTGGGGGGAASQGISPTGPSGIGHGGIGLDFSSKFGTTLGSDSGYFAGGGGSGSETAAGGTGGTGGGGDGAFSGNSGSTQGTDGTGGGGGGGYPTVSHGGRGGHGIVIVRYAV